MSREITMKIMISIWPLLVLFIVNANVKAEGTDSFFNRVENFGEESLKKYNKHQERKSGSGKNKNQKQNQNQNQNKRIPSSDDSEELNLSDDNSGGAGAGTGSGGKQEKDVVKYKDYEKLEFDELDVTGDSGKEGQLSITPREQRKFKNQLPQKDNFNYEIKQDLMKND